MPFATVIPRSTCVHCDRLSAAPRHLSPEHSEGYCSAIFTLKTIRYHPFDSYARAGCTYSPRIRDTAQTLVPNSYTLSSAATRQFPVCGSGTEFPSVCGYATVSYGNVLCLRFRETVSCPSQTQKRLRAKQSPASISMLCLRLRDTFFSRMPCPQKKCACRLLHFNISDLHFTLSSLVLAGAGASPPPATASSYSLGVQASPSTSYCLVRGCGSLTLTLSLSPSPALTHTHSPPHSRLDSLPLHSHSCTVLNCNFWLAILRHCFVLAGATLPTAAPPARIP